MYRTPGETHGEAHGRLHGHTRDATCYFDGLAGVYGTHRPSYPPDALAACTEGLATPVRVADIGCGTGIASRLLAAAGAEVTGIDPSGDMRATARRDSDGAPGRLRYMRGLAEALPLPAASVDLVLCAQAFHWFDADRALTEFHRVLVPGGRLALIWNVRVADDAFSAGYESVVEKAQAIAAAAGKVVHRNRSHWPESPDRFTGVRRLAFDNPHPLDHAGLLGRAHSATYYPQAEPERTELDAELERLFAAHEADGVVVLRQRTEVTLADRV